jgi:hypothetical protein
MIIFFLAHESGNFQITPFQNKSEPSPKNRISWAPDFFFISYARLGTRFEKSESSPKNFLGTLGTVLEIRFFQKIGFLGHRISWTPDFFFISWARLGTVLEIRFLRKIGFLGHFLGDLETSALLH